MSYDLWRTYHQGLGSKKREEENRTFLIYCIFGFGIPSLLTLIVFLIEMFHFLPDHLMPNIGEYRCWIQPGRLIEAIYVYFPISLMVLINITLFLLTANKIRRVASKVVGEAQHTRMKMAKYRYVSVKACLKY
jgi:7 transmembrane receptor (Secretin family)